MATPIPMPALSPTMTEGKITKWLKKEGDAVSSGSAIAEVETDKSNLEVEAYEDGVLLKVLVKEGESAAVGAPIGFIGEKGEQLSAVSGAPPAATAPPPAPPASGPKASPKLESAPTLRVAPVATPIHPVPAARERSDDRVRASPLAKKMARAQGLNLASLHGSGPAGRIVKRDIEQAVEGARTSKPAPRVVTRAGERAAPQQIPLTSMRKVIAQRMSEAKPGVPHFYLTVEVEMDSAMKIREEAKALEEQLKLSVNDIVVKASAMAIRRFPKINVAFAGDHLVQLGSIDVGIAVALEDGLITPIIRDADQKGLAEIASESRDLAERARKRALRPEEYTGGSLTVSNLGMFGIDSFVAVINAPQAAILAVGSVAPKPVVRDGALTVRQMISITLSGDHRAIDGAVGAQYLRELKGLLEHPTRLLF